MEYIGGEDEAFFDFCALYLQHKVNQKYMEMRNTVITSDRLIADSYIAYHHLVYLYIYRKVNTKADKIVAEAEQEYDKLKEKCLSLVQQFNQYKMQLKQVASAQLELITSDSFDVYSPEIEAIRNEKDNMIAEQVPEEPKAPKAPTKMEIPEPLVKEQPVMKETVEKEPEDLSETMVLPDVKKEKRAKKKNEELQEDILTADTIDLSDTLNQIQKPKDADTKEVTDALVLDPVDAVVKEPFEAVPNSAVTLESNPEMLSLEPEEDKKEKETPSLDSLLQNINLGKKNKKKKGKDEDPFEFLGSVDDF